MRGLPELEEPAFEVHVGGVGGEVELHVSGVADSGVDERGA